MFLQYVYEIAAFCTSVVARTPENLVFHNRNLDFAFAKMMGKMTYIGRFMKDGKEVFEATMFAGYTGIFTGIRKGAFSVSINTRKPSWRRDLTSLALNVLNISKGKTQSAKLVREVLTNCDNY